MLKKETCLGIDISGDVIKIVELQKLRGKYKVVQASVIKADNGDIPGAIWQFLLQTGTDISNVICSIPADKCSIKFARLPNAKPVETARMVRYEAENQIPLPLSDMVWGYSTERTVKKDELSFITIAAAQRSITDEITSSIRNLGIQVSALIPAPLAETRILLDSTAFDDFLIIHIGDRWMDITTVSDGKTVSCRSTEHGIRDLIQAVATDHGVSLLEIDKQFMIRALIDNLHSSRFIDSSAIVGWVTVVAQEIRRSVIALQPHEDGRSIKQVILTGEGADIPELREALEQKTGVSVVSGDPWIGMTISPVVEHISGQSSSEFTIATGLAIYGFDKRNTINLIPRQTENKSYRRRKELAVTASLGLASLILTIILIFSHSTASARAAELNRLNAEIENAKINTIQQGIKNKKLDMEKMADFLQASENNPVDILRVLSETLPVGCSISEFRFQSGESVVIRGSALSNSVVADAIYFINKAGVFKSVSLDYSNLGSGKDKSLFGFQIKCILDSDIPAYKSFGKSKNTGKRIVIR
ncbi:MAG: pilus assembly protein PilM [Armatimonadota bacterium]